MVRFTNNYNTPDVLERFGATLAATWRVPDAIAGSLRTSALPVPAPIAGHLLVDTGATGTCVALDVAEELGLIPVNIRQSYGVGGLHQNNVYAITLDLSFGTPGGVIHTLSATIEALGVPELGKHAKELRVDGAPIRMTGLLGRDVMRFATIKYCGRTGKVDYEFDFTALRPHGK